LYLGLNLLLTFLVLKRWIFQKKTQILDLYKVRHETNTQKKYKSTKIVNPCFAD
jgi:hypothetical protein